jgi:hypothetical protein
MKKTDRHSTMGACSLINNLFSNMGIAYFAYGATLDCEPNEAVCWFG